MPIETGKGADRPRLKDSLAGFQARHVGEGQICAHKVTETE